MNINSSEIDCDFSGIVFATSNFLNPYSVIPNKININKICTVVLEL